MDMLEDRDGERKNACCGPQDKNESGEIASVEHHHGYLDSQENYLKRLRRIEGQVRGLQRMVSDEKYCIDILTQISAVSGALRSVALAMLDEHMSTCVVHAARQGGDEAEVKLAEASDAIARLARS